MTGRTLLPLIYGTITNARQTTLTTDMTTRSASKTRVALFVLFEALAVMGESLRTEAISLRIGCSSGCYDLVHRLI